MKTKTYILTLSRTFPKGHPREGEETEFAEKVAQRRFAKDGAFPLMKEHIIRPDFHLWRARIDEVNAGKAVLSVREWLGAPRRSKQREIFRFDKDSGIGVEGLDMYEIINDITFVRHHNGYNSRLVEPSVIAANDGLTLDDWKAWFRDYDKSQLMAIIHLTDFRYVILKNTRL